MNKFTKTLILLLTALMMLCANEAMAKLKVTSLSSSAKVPQTGGSSSGTKLYCNGLDVLVREVNGETQVLVDENQDGVFDDNPDNEDNELVELEGELTWEMVEIYIGGNYCTEGHTTKFTMTGGHINCVYPTSPRASNGEERAVTKGEIYLDIRGGSLSDIVMKDGMFDIGKAFAETAMVTMVVNNAKYEGYRFPDLKVAYYVDLETGQLDFFSNISVVMTNCTFRDAECLFYVRPNEYDGEGGGFITNADGSRYTAFGNVTIPAGVTVATDTITVLPGAVVNNLGTVKFRGCVGVKQMEGTWNGRAIQESAGHGRTIVRTVRATCTTSGSATITCLDCKKVIDRRVLLALGHNNITEPAIAATCTTSGMTSGTYCSRCGLVSKKVTPVAPTHNWHEVANASEMKQLGITPDNFYWCESEVSGVRVCTSCKKVEAIEPAVLSSDDHSWSVYTSDNNATCSTYPTKTRHCTHFTTYNSKRVPCRATQTIVDTSGSLKDHVMLEHPAKEPTCETEGNEFYYSCTSCGKYFNESKSRIQSYIAIPANGHTFDEKSVSRNGLPDKNALASSATCTEPRTYFYSCSVCGVIGDESTYPYGRPRGHSYELQSIDYINPTAPETGTVTLHCTTCNDVQPNFAFSYNKTRTSSTGIAYSSKLARTITPATCQPGVGEYALNIQYGTNNISTTYEAPIIPIYAEDSEGNIIPDTYLIHDWDENGHCSHHHDADVAGYIRYTKSQDLGDGYIYNYDDGIAFASQNEMFASESAQAALDNKEAKLFADYTLADGAAFTNPVSGGFTATHFRYNRAVTGGRIVTFVLPANVPTACFNGAVYKFSNFDDVENKFVFDEYEESETEANVPYLIVLDDDATTLMSAPATAVTVNAEGDLINEVGNAAQVGAYETTPIASSASKSYYGYDSADGVFVKALSGTINPFRSAFSLTSASQAASRIRLQLGSDEQSAIISVEADKLDAEGSEIYDLTGKKVSLTEKGHIYIINGKKQLK